MDIENDSNIFNQDSLENDNIFNYQIYQEENQQLLDIGIALYQEMFEYNPSQNYYQFFWKEKLKMDTLRLKWREEVKEINQLGIKIQNNLQQIEMKQNYELSKLSDKHSRFRRAAKEIERKYKCPYNECVRDYGTLVSLNLHIKKKHNGGTQTQRVKIYKDIIEGKDYHGLQQVNFPPGHKEKLEKIASIGY